MMTMTCEPLNRDWVSMKMPDKTLFESAIDYCVEMTRKNLSVYRRTFFDSSAVDNVYPERGNEPWTTGFCTGMVWIAYELTKDNEFFDVGKRHTGFFKERLDYKKELSHDIGFLYSLSAVADYKLTGDESAKKLSVKAADALCWFYRPIPGIIQRGGDMTDINHDFTGVFIIDCLMNVPLLYWASEVTGDPKYMEIGYQHTLNSLKALARDQGNMVQKGKGDPFSGEITNFPMESQGYRGEGGCWSRGQAWAMYGLPLTYAYVNDSDMLEASKAITNYYLNRLPNDYIANWDLFYKDEDGIRDSSASAIAVCGMLEYASHLPLCDAYRQILEMASLKTLESLVVNYMTSYNDNSNALLKSGTYAYNSGRGINEPCIWGDYFFMEALWRVLRTYTRFW